MNDRGLEDLSAPDMSHILKYLSWKDKKNLRLVSKHFATSINKATTWKLVVNRINLSKKIDLLRKGKIDCCLSGEEPGA